MMMIANRLPPPSLQKGKGKGKDKGTAVTDVDVDVEVKSLEHGIGFGVEEEEAAKRIMTEEEYNKKSVSVATYGSYLVKLMPIGLLIPYFLLQTAYIVIVILYSWWAGIIGNPAVFSNIPFWTKIYIYAVMICGEAAIMLAVSVTSAFAVRRANTRIHDRLLAHVVNAPPAFFDTTPLGRIINRFAAELSQTDLFLHLYLLKAVYYYICIVGFIIIIAVTTPSFLYIGIPAFVFFLSVLFVYSGPSRNLQRMDSIARSPVLTLFGETITGAGLATIKAYGLQEEWKRRFREVNDEWSAKRLLFREGQRWATTYTAVAASIFMTGVVVIGWFAMNPVDLSVAVANSQLFGIYAVLIVLQNVELDSRMTSYERVLHYSTRLPQESSRSTIEPPQNWPEKGAIVFDRVTFRYRPGLPFVLHDVSFAIAPGEKIGVCGRTGAGKSSLLYVMFRLVELDPGLMPKLIDIKTGFPMETPFDEPPNSGHILLDNIDISQVVISRMRQAISIIPQDPTLFTGTVRYNLDLASRCSDEEVMNVLDLTSMRETVLNLPHGLDTVVTEDTFSCGHRQLLCFARAILNDSRIIVLDEATANIDDDADAKIQEMIHTHLKDRTVVVIAHRLNTIINSDRILVLDKGVILEFDSPANLKNNLSSAFNSLLESSEES